MPKDSGYLVKTNTGLCGRTYHRDGMVNKKIVVYITDDKGKIIKYLFSYENITITGFID